MATANDKALRDVILDSWDRNNRILINLLRAVPSDGLAARAMPGSPSVSQMFTHLHYVRLVFLTEDTPDCALPMPDSEWSQEDHADRIAAALQTSGSAVRNAVETRLLDGKPMALHYDHPLLYLQHMIWHEGYHHGQIKLALKLSGQPLENKAVGPLTWRVWMNKTAAS